MSSHSNVDTAQQTERLERLITEELGECCAADVDARLETLERYDADAPTPAEADLNALHSLGNETRYSIVRLLLAADESLCVCEIAHFIEVSDSAISHALSDLHDAGLVTREKDGQWRYYEPTDRAEARIGALDRTQTTTESQPTGPAVSTRSWLSIVPWSSP